MGDHDFARKAISDGELWQVKRKRRKAFPIVGIPVDGEKKFGDVGLSHGWLHFKDYETSKVAGFCGVSYFRKNGIEIS